MSAHGDVQERCDVFARKILAACRRRGLYIACAESLTAGLLSDAFVRIPQASDVFLGSSVTYNNEAKASILGVDSSVLDAHGAVYPLVAEQMAKGAVGLYTYPSVRGKVLGLSTTGVAGPGPSDGHPAGLVYVGIAVPNVVCGKNASQSDYDSESYELHIQGSREMIRRTTVLQVLIRVSQILDLE